MSDQAHIGTAVADLIEVLHLQAQEIQKLSTFVEQQTGRLPHASQMPLVLSELSELHQRVRRLAGGGEETGSIPPVTRRPQKR